MPGNRRSGWASPLLRGGAVLGVLLVGVGVILCWEAPGQAEAAMLSAQNAGVFKTQDKLLITIGVANPDEKEVRGTLTVELIDAKCKSVGKSRQTVQQSDKAASYRFELPLTGLSADQVTLRCHFGDKEQFSAKVSDLILAKAHETSLSSGQEFQAGSTASLRCTVQGVKSLTETVPLAGADVVIRLKDKDGKVQELYKGKAGVDGVATAEFKVPALPTGQYKMEVATKSALGEEKLERDVRIKSESKVLLVTDKPLYQPGQLIHIRALALRPFDLAPVAGQDLMIEVEDSKGNKVFKRTHKTSDYGVAAVDFQLADEVNMGDYQVRAQLGETQSNKTVSVKRYVLPKFKNDVKADKAFYLPKETIKAELQSDYFFGKPVAGGKVKVTASTFDVAFKDFQTWEGKTDANGHTSFEVKLPDYFVGQPLAKGDAIVKLEVKVTDTADHTETITKTYPVSSAPIRVSLIPEGGRVVPGLDNRIFVAAIYPDGSPAKCDVNLTFVAPVNANLGPPLEEEGRGHEKPDPAANKKPFAKVTTNEAGLAEFTVAPKADQFRKAQWEQQNIELLGGQQHPWWGQKSYLDILVEAKDKNGAGISFVSGINADPFGENLVLRLDKAIYKGGDLVQVDVRSSAGLPTAYLDVTKSGQTLLTKWLDVKDGKAMHKLDLPQTVFGTLELHAYQMLAGGEILRDTRVIYVQPSSDLKIDVKADKNEYLPGSEGRIRFTVSDAAGKPTAAALGVIIVDEAVYALQEMQPGLEKVYFTLQEELLRPQAQAVYKPSEPIPVLIQQPELPMAKQQIAQALLASVKPKAMPRWEVDPAIERRRQMEGQIQQIGWALFNYAQNHEFLDYDKTAKRWNFKPDLLKQAVQWQGNLPPAVPVPAVLDPDNREHPVASKEQGEKDLPALLRDPLGRPLSLDALAKLVKGFTPDYLARSVTASHMQTILGQFLNHTQANRAKWFKDGKWKFPDTVLADAIKAQKLDRQWLKDAWGREMKVVKRDKKWEPNPWGRDEFFYHEFVSAGPDGKFGTDDDVKLSDLINWNGWGWWQGGEVLHLKLGDIGGRNATRLMILERADVLREALAVPLAAPAAGGVGGGGPRFANAPGPAGPPMKEAKNGHGGEDKSKAAGSAQPTRLREFFPETMLWQPSLITDDQGRAELPVQFADSITTWRLSASASSRGGALGGVTAALRVFQDFFVDLDLPIALTQNDEVAFPVAVYNYLKTPQTVKLDLKPEAWFELVGDKGLSRSLDLKPNEVTSISYRIRAKKIGNFPLEVKATGSKMSDAIKRGIEVVPDGTKIEVVASDRLAGNVSKTLTIPADSVADASKILVKIYPGVFSQVLEGTEGMLRLPGG
jgi:hypothetical protein